MADVEYTQPAANNTVPAKASDRPSERLVRHVFWKYPILSLVLLIVVAAVAFAVGSPNWHRDTIASVTKDNRGGAIMAFTQELDGTATSTSNAAEFGMGDPGQVFGIGPLRQVAPLWRADFRAALAAYDAASPQQQLAWAKT